MDARTSAEKLEALRIMDVHSRKMYISGAVTLSDRPNFTQEKGLKRWEMWCK